MSLFVSKGGLVPRFSDTNAPSLPSIRFRSSFVGRYVLIAAGLVVFLCLVLLVFAYCLLSFRDILAEAERLVKGVNILVVTPGRLLDHLQVRLYHTWYRLYYRSPRWRSRLSSSLVWVSFVSSSPPRVHTRINS